MNTEHTPKCGCRITRNGAAIWVYYKIQYCPLHKAAPDLLDSMERLVNAVSGVDHDKALRDCRAAVAKAKGGQG